MKYGDKLGALFAYVNCRVYNSKYKIFQKVGKTFIRELDKTGFGLSFIYEKLISFAANKQIVIVLDEIDMIKDADDFSEWRNMNFFQGNILKVAWTFNVGRHDGTSQERDLNKVIHYANREKLRLTRANLLESTMQVFVIIRGSASAETDILETVQLVQVELSSLVWHIVLI